MSSIYPTSSKKNKSFPKYLPLPPLIPIYNIPPPRAPTYPHARDPSPPIQDVAFHDPPIHPPTITPLYNPPILSPLYSHPLTSFYFPCIDAPSSGILSEPPLPMTVNQIKYTENG